MKNLFKGIAIGCALTICAGITVISSAEAVRKEIYAIYDDIRIVVHGKKITPKDADGKVVDPFIYQGTTYLPVRAISNALGEKVDWDDETNTVYIGGKVKTEDVPMTALKAISGVNFVDGSVSCEHRGKKLITDNYFQFPGSYDGVFVLNGEYKELNGLLIVPDSYVGSEGVVTFTDVDTGEVIEEFTTEHGAKPVKVSVDVLGVDKLRVYVKNGVFYNAYLTPIGK